MAPNIKLVYFPVKGRGELVRLVLHAGGFEYEEELVDFGEWPERKDDTPFLTLPYMEWDDEVIGQSLPMARWIGKQAGIGGSDMLEAARVDAMMEHCSEFLNDYYGIRFTEDPDEKAKKKSHFLENQLPKFLTTSEALLEKAGGEKFGGGDFHFPMSVADVALFHILDVLANPIIAEGHGVGDEHREMLKEMSRRRGLTKLHRRVKEHPRIAAYLRVRPAYPF